MNKSSAYREVAVWDTYVQRKDGSVMHFDIIVPAQVKDQKKIFEYGRQYAKTKGVPDAPINTARCQFCHLETTTADIDKAISYQGYAILEMEDIPKELPSNPNKRQLAFHLKAHFENFRFTNFSGVSTDEIQRLILIEEEKQNQMQEKLFGKIP